MEKENTNQLKSNYYLVGNADFFTQLVRKNNPQSHCHDFFECFLVTSGRVTHYIDNESAISLAENTLVLIPTGVYHRIETIDGKDSLHRDLLFSTKILNEVFPANFPELYKNLQKKEALIAESLDSLSIDCLNWYLHNLNDSKNYSRTFIVGLLYTIGCIFTAHNKADDNRQTYPPFVQDIMFHIKNQSIFHMSWNEIFNLNHYSKTYTCKMFKKYIGTTLTEYIAKEKMACAANMLLNTDYSISYIMQQLNIASPAYFIKQFKKYYNTLPSTFRQHTFTI